LILQAIPGYRQLEREGVFTYFNVFNALHYLWTPFALLWKFTLIAFTLWIGAFMAGYKLSFKELWKFTMVAEIVFILPEFFRLLWFLAVEQPESFQDIENFHLFSLFSLLDAGQTEKRFHYPLQALNIFEFAYWFILAIGLHTISRISFTRSLWVVLGSYTLCFFLWLGFYIVVYK
jgi:hypothetical protein